MTPEDYITKARRALRSATSLLDDEDYEGSANRAYYAMFHAARAALLRRGIDIRSRKHGTVVGQFSRHFVASGTLPKALGRAFNDVQKLRQTGDYDVPPVVRVDVEQALASAQEFVATVERLIRD